MNLCFISYFKCSELFIWLLNSCKSKLQLNIKLYFVFTALEGIIELATKLCSIINVVCLSENEVTVIAR